MKIERKGPASGSFEYRWRVDAEEGFDTAKFMYDRNGKLIAVDFGIAKRATPTKPPTPPEV